MLSIPKFDIPNLDHYHRLSSTVQKLDYCDSQLASFRRTGLDIESTIKKGEKDYWVRERDTLLTNEYDNEFEEILERLHKKSILCQDTGYFLEHLYAKENVRLRQGARFGYWSSRAYMLFGLCCFISASVIAINKYYILAHLKRADIWNISFCLIAGVGFFIGAWCLNVWLLYLMRQVKIEVKDDIQSSEVESINSFSDSYGSKSEFDSFLGDGRDKISLKINDQEDAEDCCLIS